MNANEIQDAVVLGSHSRVKAFLAPLIAQVVSVVAAVEPKAEVSYSGSGGVRVMLEADDCASAKECWARIYKAARAVRAALPESLKVSKPHRGCVHGGTFTIVRDSFNVTVR